MGIGLLIFLVSFFVVGVAATVTGLWSWHNREMLRGRSAQAMAQAKVWAKKPHPRAKRWFKKPYWRSNAHNRLFIAALVLTPILALSGLGKGGLIGLLIGLFLGSLVAYYLLMAANFGRQKAYSTIKSKFVKQESESEGK